MSTNKFTPFDNPEILLSSSAGILYKPQTSNSGKNTVSHSSSTNTLCKKKMKNVDPKKKGTKFNHLHQLTTTTPNISVTAQTPTATSVGHTTANKTIIAILST